MSGERAVFHDPSGRRARWVGLALGLLGSLLFALFAVFAFQLAYAPKLPPLDYKNPQVLKALHVETAHRLKWRAPWGRAPRPPKAQAGPGARPLTVGFYVSWDERARHDLQQHIAQIDVVAPQWVSLGGPGGKLAVTVDVQADAIIASAAKRPSVLPLVHNARDEVWDGPLADRAILDGGARRALIDELVALARRRGFGGYVLDLENLSPKAAAAYPGFVRELRAALATDRRELWVTTPFAADASWDLPALQAASDALVVMAYDEHWATAKPGPPAGQAWFERNLQALMMRLDPARTILALGAYGYDWPAKGPAEAVTFQEAAQIAHDSGAEIDFDDDALNAHFAYQDDAGGAHQVWFLDAASLFNQVKVAAPWRPRGYALWRLGAEDPGVWPVLARPAGAAVPDDLKTIGVGEDVEFNGTGEILHVSATPRPGARTTTLDPDTGLIADERFDVLPTSYVIQRLGAHPGLVALTFDDGPSARWTPKILDILKAKAAPATFFVIGEHMEAEPELVARALREGHDVGSHTYTHPNIGQTPPAETRVELNATQRLFETITGRSLRLFRPPFFGDAEPSTPAEVAPLLTAQHLGYLTVGLRIDPDDWKRPDAGLIVSRTLARLGDRGERAGQVVLLHDAGGDRSQTVKALPKLIDALRAHGYRLTTVSQLAGMTRDEAMPPARRGSASLVVDRAAFFLVRSFNRAVTALFLTAIGLGLARLLFLSVFALIHRLRIAGATPPEPLGEGGPLVSVLIPCFNEAAVIAASVRRILASDWRNLEILVLDDGSGDRTAAVVQGAFADEPRVRLFRFENGGKARALNRGLVHAQGDIVVALDADTLFPPETLGRLARWFADPRVGAVAGNALVGNRVNVLTRWQALEYVSAQNLERRALSTLGAVTVVPGAVGAWRAQALRELGGYPADTLAEDQDLTLAVQQAGWRVEFDPEARAYTEAPDTLQGLLKQRFRWSFGTLQCLWKHRAALFSRRHAVLGWIALPQVWLFQIVLTVLAPLVDLAVVWSLIAAGIDRFAHAEQWSSDNLVRAGLYWSAFVLVDLSAAAFGLAMERKAPWTSLPWLPVQRFGYRQMMYYVVLKAVAVAVGGPRVGWGKLDRKGTVAVEG